MLRVTVLPFDAFATESAVVVNTRPLASFVIAYMSKPAYYYSYWLYY